MGFNSKYYHNTACPSIYIKPITTNSKINKKQNRNKREMYIMASKATETNIKLELSK